MRTTWNVTKLADAPIEIVDGDRGQNYPQHTDFMDNGFCLFLNAGNVTNSGFSFNNLQFITAEKDEMLRKGKLHRNDVVLTTRGTIGNAAYYDERVPFEHVRINSGMVILRCDQNHILSSFVYHYLRSPSFHAQVNAFRSGVAQPQLPIRDMRQIKLPIPTLIEQQRISNVLSAYDDLIENNRRRIQLLEESARLLYREWFVYLRFPGHEHVKVVDGVPEGWERKTLGQKIVLNYGKALKSEERIDGQYPVYGSSGIIGSHEKALTTGPGIIVGRKGNVGSIYWSYKDYWPIDTVYFITSDQSTYYLYHVLHSMQFVSSDAAVPGLNRDFAYSRLYLQPSNLLMNQFEETVKPVYEQVFKLEQQNEKLRQARDLLLPRLMNGEIEV